MIKLRYGIIVVPLVCATWLAALAIGTETKGMGESDMSGDAAAAMDGTGNWRAEPNTRVVSSDHWTWSLHGIERHGDLLIVDLRFRNNGTTARPMFMGDVSTVVLIDRDTGTEYPVIEAEGISDEAIRVERRASEHAKFTFDVPPEVSSVQFSSNWVTMLMRGAATISPVEFDMKLPPDDAAPI